MAGRHAADMATLAAGMTAVKLGEVAVLLVREGNDVRAFEGTCPHAKAPLETGVLCRGRIICPWHMGAFDAATGALLEPVAMRGLHRYAVTVEDGRVSVDTDAPPGAPVRPAGDGRVFVLAGAGAAAATAAATLRQDGFTGRVVMVGPDAAEPLDRTQLSKMAIAAADFDRGTLPLLHPEELAGMAIERVVARVTALDAAGRRVQLSDGSTLGYDALLLATGAAPKPPPFPGGEAAKVLRHLGDVDAILADVRPGGRAVVIGSSFIGMEAASALAERKMAVTMVGQESVPFAGLFGDRVGAAVRALHESKGVRFRLGTGVARVDPGAVVLDTGETLGAELVLAGLGVAPVVDYAPDLPRAGDGGLVTDGGLRVTDGIWAAGDIASPAGWPRIEHWRVAQQHGRIAAKGMLGQEARYGGVPFFWSAQAGKRLQSLGHAPGWDEVAYDGDVEAFDFTAWFLSEGKVKAALVCARDKAAATLSDAMREPLSLAEARARVSA